MAKKDFSDINISLDRYFKHDYYQKIVNYLKGKTILDVGCIDDGELAANQVRLWNHWFLFSMGKSTLGIDIRTDPINQLRRMGFNVKHMDAQRIKFNYKFDVIFAGEIIEHLPNPGLFLTSAAKALTRSGSLILSTPNPFSLSRIIRVIQSQTNEPAVNPDHTMYLSPQNVQTLAKKCGLIVKKIDYAHFPFTRDNWLVKLNKLGCWILGERFKEQMLVFIQQ